MKKTILIAPFDGRLAEALAAEARAAGWSVALALASPPAGSEGQIEGKGAGDETADTVTLSYKPSSFVSISALVLAARNALGEIDAAVIVGDSSSARADFAAGKPGELDLLVEERCASPLYLARELTKRFEARRAGRLLLLAPESPRDASLGPVAALAAGAFEGLGKGLFSAAEGTAWSVYGVQDASGQSERAARFALGLLDDPKRAKAGRWIRFSGRSGIFGV